jgi:glutathione S-transferase
MKLYYTKGACSLAIRIVINELNFSAEYEAVDLKTKKTEQGDDYYQINPKGSVPALKLDNGQVLTENAAIQQYLADLGHATTLLPAVSDLKRYRVLEWLSFINSDFHKSCGILFNAAIPQSIKDEVFIPAVKAKLAYLDKHLENNVYLLDHYTLPDGYLFVILSWLAHFNIDLSQWTHVFRYFNELKKRPSIEKSLKEEGF